MKVFLHKVQAFFHAVNLMFMWLLLSIPAAAVMSGLAYIFFDVTNRYRDVECLLKICSSCYFLALLLVFPLCVQTLSEQIRSCT